MQRALQGTGFTWSGEGELTFGPDCMALVNELDGLIEAFGRDARAAELFPGRFSGEEELS